MSVYSFLFFCSFKKSFIWKAEWQLFHQLVHCLNAHNIQGQTGLQPGTPVLPYGGRDPSTERSHAASDCTLAGNWAGSQSGPPAGRSDTGCRGFWTAVPQCPRTSVTEHNGKPWQFADFPGICYIGMQSSNYLSKAATNPPKKANSTKISRFPEAWNTEMNPDDSKWVNHTDPKDPSQLMWWYL